MIRINLAKRKQFGGALSVGKTGSGVSAASTALFDLRKTLQSGSGNVFLQMGLPIVIGIGLYFLTEFYFDHQREQMKAEVAQIEEQQRVVTVELARMKGFEITKKDLEKNEKILRNKIEVIQKLVENRDHAFRATVALSQSIPADAWITELVETDTVWTLRGSATDVNQVSDFMARLNQTIYYKDIALKSASSNPQGTQTDFEFNARRE